MSIVRHPSSLFRRQPSPRLYGKRVMLRRMLGSLLRHDLASLAHLRPPRLTWDVVTSGLRLARRLRGGAIELGELVVHALLLRGGQVVAELTSDDLLDDSEGIEQVNRRDPITVPRLEGCDKCGGTGYSGRLGVYEMLLNSEKIESLTVQRAASEEIRRQARKEGMITLREDGLRKVMAGETTVDELMRTVS